MQYDIPFRLQGGHGCDFNMTCKFVLKFCPNMNVEIAELSGCDVLLALLVLAVRGEEQQE